jgi:hypothetical protein
VAEQLLDQAPFQLSCFAADDRCTARVATSTHHDHSDQRINRQPTQFAATLAPAVHCGRAVARRSPMDDLASGAK